MGKIVSLCKRRGFVFQSSEIYGGINGFWDYGPLGAELKRNVKELWWHAMTRQRNDVAGLEATIIMSPEIWKASGHVATFSDPMCDCLLTKKRFRADQIEPQSGVAYWYSGAKMELTEKYNALLDELEKFSNEFAALATVQPRTEETSQKIKELQAHHKETYEEYKKLRPKFQQEAKEFDANVVPSQIEERVIEALKKTGDSFDAQIAGVFEKKYQKRWQDYYETEKPYAVLLQPDQTSAAAERKARKYYESLGYHFPKPKFERTEIIENSQRFNPDKGEGYGGLLTEPVPFNLMFKTYVGPTATEADVAYLRPETAQAIFAQFKNVLDTARQKVPFGIGQIGKAFRNEVTPRNFIFRSREFEQMELEFFIKPDEAIEAIYGSVATVPPTGHPGAPQPNWGWQAWHQYWVEERVRFYEGIGLSRDTLGFHHQTPEELAHYARACTDILFKFPFSKKDEQGNVTGDELEGIAARGDFDLSQHQRFSGKPMTVFDEELRAAWGKLPKEKSDALYQRYYAHRKNYLLKSGVEEAPAATQAAEDANGLAKGVYIPHVIEPSAGVDRLILALIANAFSEETKTDDKGKSETTVTMKFHPRVAPFKAGIFPLLKNKPELVAKAQAVRDLLRPWMNVFYDESGSIGKRYARQDEAGTPFCVTIDFDTLGEKPELLDTVTLRYRDAGKQERLKISELRDWLLAKVR